jgi:hypothetical protein
MFFVHPVDDFGSTAQPATALGLLQYALIFVALVSSPLSAKIVSWMKKN